MILGAYCVGCRLLAWGVMVSLGQDLLDESGHKASLAAGSLQRGTYRQSEGVEGPKSPE